MCVDNKVPGGPEPCSFIMGLMNKVQENERK
jgi:hypothetical protein